MGTDNLFLWLYKAQPLFKNKYVIDTYQFMDWRLVIISEPWVFNENKIRIDKEMR
jgi:hypothetical protein